MRHPLLRYLRFWRAWISVLAPIILIAIPLSYTKQDTDGKEDEKKPSIEKALWCAYCILVCAVYWVFECAPLAITSMIPVVILPLAGVLGTNEVCMNYLTGTNMMFLAGLIMAIAVEHSGLHERVALNIIRAIGTSRRRLMLGFMLCTMFLSMWISNTAATAMMVPILDAIDSAVNKVNEIEIGGKDIDSEEEERKSKKSSASRNILLLSTAYAANIGGTGVITGSPPNLVVLADLQKKYSDNPGGDMLPLNYATWMGFSVPLMLINVFAAYALLTAVEWFMTRKDNQQNTRGNDAKVKSILDRKYSDLGNITWHEIQVLVLFIILVILWFFQNPRFIPGWNGLFTEVKIKSATPAVLVVWLLFLLPKNPNLDSPSPALLDWITVEKKLPWGVIMLLGGGFALAAATESSGLSALLSAQLSGLKDLGYWQINLLVSFITTFVTEVASNTATANIVVPILNEMSRNLCVNPIYLMMTSAICCSYAFMLPVATAPNAIVFSHSTLKTSEMMKIGFLLNIFCIFTTNLAINTWGMPIYGLGEFPAWAAANTNCSSTSLLANQTLPSPSVG